MEGRDCINPAQAYTNLFIPPLFSVVKTVKEASAVCRSFLDGVVIFLFNLGHLNDNTGDVKEALKSSIFVVQKAAAPKMG